MARVTKFLSKQLSVLISILTMVFHWILTKAGWGQSVLMQDITTGLTNILFLPFGQQVLPPLGRKRSFTIWEQWIIGFSLPLTMIYLFLPMVISPINRLRATYVVSA